MTYHTIPLPLSYRKHELTAIFRNLQAGDSCAVVGASGMAKSNLFRHLLKPEVRTQYLGEKWQRCIFVAIDANEAPELSERAISDLIHQRLIDAYRTWEFTQTGADCSQRLSRESYVKVPAQIAFVDNIAHVLEEPLTQLVFVFDQFDAIYKSLEGRFFANLRAVRDQHKYRISYVVFTRTPLGQLCHSPEHEEFEELFGADVIGLGPYCEADALVLMDRVSARYGSVLQKRIRERLVSLTGGHPGILKAATTAVLKGQLELPKEDPAATQALLTHLDVLLECNKLWSSVSLAEQVCLREISSGRSTARESAERRLLTWKGLARNEGAELTLSMPVFALYVLTAKEEPQVATRISAGCFRIDTGGEVWVNRERVIPVLSRRELLLLEYLCLEPGQLRTKDEIIAVVYPDEFRSGESISDDALNALFKRLRERLNRFDGSGERIVTIRGKGYRLNIT